MDAISPSPKEVKWPQPGYVRICRFGMPFIGTSREMYSRCARLDSAVNPNKNSLMSMDCELPLSVIWIADRDIGSKPNESSKLMIKCQPRCVVARTFHLNC